MNKNLYSIFYVLLFIQCILFTSCTDKYQTANINIIKEFSADVEIKEDQNYYQAEIIKTNDFVSSLYITQPQELKGLKLQKLEDKYEMSFESLIASDSYLLPDDCFIQVVMDSLESLDKNQSISFNKIQQNKFQFKANGKYGDFYGIINDSGQIERLNIDYKNIEVLFHNYK